MEMTVSLDFVSTTPIVMHAQRQRDPGEPAESNLEMVARICDAMPSGTPNLAPPNRLTSSQSLSLFTANNTWRGSLYFLLLLFKMGSQIARHCHTKFSDKGGIIEIVICSVQNDRKRAVLFVVRSTWFYQNIWFFTKNYSIPSKQPTVDYKR